MAMIHLLQRLAQRRRWSARQVAVLAYFCRSPGGSIRDAAASLVLPKAAVTRAVDGLVAGKLLTRTRHERDARLRILRASAKGVAMVRDMEAAAALPSTAPLATKGAK